MTHSRSLPELAYAIQSRTLRLYDFFQEEELPQPSFSRVVGQENSSCLTHLPEKLQGHRAQLLEALDELRALILGPTSHLFFLVFLGPAWTATLRVIYRYRIAQHLPLDKALSFKELSQLCGLSEADTTRYVRAAVTLRVFEESPPGIVRHNAVSAELATTLLHDFVGFANEEIGPAAHTVVEALEKHPESQDPARSAYALANGGNGEQDLFALIKDDPARVDRLSKAMSFAMDIPDMAVRYAVDNVPWVASDGGEVVDSGNCPEVIVDVGGSRGTLCEALLRRYPQISKAVVVDLPEVVEQAEREIVDRMDGRLEFRAHSFFDEQVVGDADVYFFRCVFHDWADSYVVRILRNQIPALKPGARIVINERCIEPPQPATLFRDQFAAASDIFMQLCANARERSREDWARLLAQADERFEMKSVVTPRHSALSLIEVVWNGTKRSEQNEESRDATVANGNTDGDSLEEAVATEVHHEEKEETRQSPPKSEDSPKIEDDASPLQSVMSKREGSSHTEKEVARLQDQDILPHG